MTEATSDVSVGVIDLDQLDQVKTSFTELGDTISEVASTNSRMFGDFSSALAGDFKKVSESLSAGESVVSGGGVSVNMSEEFQSKVAASFDRISAQMDVSMSGLAKILQTADAQFNKMTEDSQKLLDQAALATGAGKKGGSTSSGGKGKGGKQGRSLGKQELNALLSKGGGFLKQFKIPLPGAIAAGAAGIMAYGVQDRLRVEAEAGEVRNILIGAYEGGVKGAVEAGTKYLSDLQQKLFSFYGVNKQETQAVATSFVAGGVSVKQMLRNQKTDIQDFSDNAVTNTLGLDFMFRTASGTNATRAVQMMANYGKTITQAVESTIRLNMLGKQSGIGADQFVKNVEAAAQPLEKMGIDIDQVLDIYDYAVTQYAKMDVPAQFAGKQAAEGLSQITNGIANLSVSWQMVMAESLYPDKSGLEARQEMLDGFLRLKDKDKPKEMVKMIMVAYEIALKAAGGDEAKARLFMDQNMGFGFQGTKLASIIYTNEKEGKHVEATKVAGENLATLSNIMGVKRTERNEFDVWLAQMNKGMAKMGQGLMGLVIHSVAWLIMYFKALPDILKNLLPITVNGKQKNARIFQDIELALGDTGLMNALVKEGWGTFYGGAKGMGPSLMGNAMKKLWSAYKYNPMTGIPLDKGGPGSSGTASAGSSSGGAPPVNMSVANPAEPTWDSPASGGGGQTGFTPSPGAGKASGGDRYDKGASKQLQLVVGDSGGGGGEAAWVGGTLLAVFKGITPDHQIVLGLEGNCPRCGWVVGATPPKRKTKDKGKHSSRVRSNTIRHARSGNKIEADYSDPDFLDELRDTSTSQKVKDWYTSKGQDMPNLDPELISVLQELESAFPGKSIQINRSLGENSGGSQHGKGAALDLHIPGVANEDLFKFLESQGYGSDHGGLGYYPNSTFVHVDTRKKNPAKWVDLSAPGKKSSYVKNAETWLADNMTGRYK